MGSEAEIKFNCEIDVTVVRAFAADEWVEEAAWNSTASARTDRPTGGLIRSLMRERHGTPFEFGGWFTIKVHAPIFVFREWQRHRVAWSYNEQSGRYTEFEPEFYVPGPDRPVVQTGRRMDYDMRPGTPSQRTRAVESAKEACRTAWREYRDMLDHGIAREVARNVLPVGTYSTMYAAANPRALMHFLSLRTADVFAAYPSKPQWEIDKGARSVEAVFAEMMPITCAAWHENGRVAP